jgi:hypothetical protein
MVDLDTLEGAATLSSMDTQRRNLQFQDVAYQTMTVHAPSSSNFSQEPKGKGAETMHETPVDATSAHLMNNAILDIDDSSLADFLRDIMMPTPPNPLPGAGPHSLDFVQQNYYSGRDVFNFGIDSSLDFTDIDFGWISTQNARLPGLNFPTALDPDRERSERGQHMPDVSSGITAGAEAFQKSVWRWRPDQQDHGHAEQVNLSLPYKDLRLLEPRHGPEGLDRRLEQNSRDKILAMLLSGCEPKNVSRVVASFPSADLLDSLMQNFFRSEVHRTDSWIHLPTFRPQNQRPELNGIIVAAGAVLSTVPTVRKLGFAIQEAVRLAIPVVVSSRSLTLTTISLLTSFEFPSVSRITVQHENYR